VLPVGLCNIVLTSKSIISFFFRHLNLIQKKKNRFENTMLFCGTLTFKQRFGIFGAFVSRNKRMFKTDKES